MPLADSVRARSLYRCRFWVKGCEAKGNNHLCHFCENFCVIFRDALLWNPIQKICSKTHCNKKFKPSSFEKHWHCPPQGPFQIDTSIIYLYKNQETPFLWIIPRMRTNAEKTSEWRRYKKPRKCQRTDKKSLSDIHKFHCDIIHVSSIHRRVISDSVCITSGKCSMRVQPSA